MKSALVLLTAANAINVRELFTDFKKKFNVTYKSAAEELERIEIFADNVDKLDRVGDATLSHLTPFADKTEAEMGVYKGFRPHLSKGKTNLKQMPPLDTLNLPKSFDWREKGAVNDPKNQAQCGSCWAFATVANIEGVNQVATGKLVSLSEQELVDCSKQDNGCNGGLPENAYEDMISGKMGLEYEKDYTYHAVGGTCKAKQSLEKVFIDDWASVSKDEDQIAAALMKYGPLAIGINAQWMQFYTGGISNPPFCDPSALDHGVAIVGFGEEDGKQYWVIRNSWGKSWGEEGYYRIIRGKGKCGLNSMVTSAVINKSETPILI